MINILFLLYNLMLLILILILQRKVHKVMLEGIELHTELQKQIHQIMRVLLVREKGK